MFIDVCYSGAMTFTTIQKPIKIGTSRGVILPAKELKRLGVTEKDELELIVRKKTKLASDKKVLETALDIMSRYKTDFKNLARR